MTYYEVVCDGCGARTGDLGDYSAWAERFAAEDQWQDYDGLISEPLTFCDGCVPRCACGNRQDEESGPPFFCEDCNEKQPTHDDIRADLDPEDQP